MTKRYFIAGTGTDIGKTFFTCALAQRLKKAGSSVRALKPVISGFDAQNAGGSDTGLLLAAQGLSLSSSGIDAVSPWRFAVPLSPDMAAEDEGKVIDFAQLVDFCRAPQDTDYLLVESAGGVMSPLTAMHTMLDWAAALNFPVILVAGSYLGALSHTLTAAHALIAARLALHAVIISESEASPVPLARTVSALRRFLPGEIRILPIERLDSSRELWNTVPDLLQRLCP